MIQMKKMQYVVASLLAASIFTTAAEAANFNNEVKTQQGVVAGAYDDKHQVVQWLGVPYAQQPTGADRWREAQQAKKHKGILDWVRENIKEFGGDAKNITVSGFSASGRDVMAMLISPVFKNKFDKAISFSGGLTVADAAKSQKTIAQKLAPMVVEDGKQNNLPSGTCMGCQPSACTHQQYQQ